MGAYTTAAKYLSPEEVKPRWQCAQKQSTKQHWLIIYNALVDPRPALRISQHVGVGKSTVHRIISQYNRYGSEALDKPGKGGRHDGSGHLTAAEEKEFIDSFRAKAVKGQIATAKEIKIALEKKLQQKVHISTIYRMLERQQWRKIKPRPAHPKASVEILSRV
jgi:transposase